MFGRLKNAGKSFVLATEGFFSSSEPATTYVKDLRKVLTYHDGRKARKCQYPSNYPQIVNSYQIIQEKNNEGKLVYKLLDRTKDKKGEQTKFELALVKPAGDKSYFTLEFLVNPKAKRYSGFYKPFDFTKIDLEKHLPIFEVDSSFRLTNSSVPAKIEEVRDNHGKSIEDQDGNLKYILSYKEEEKEEKFDLILVKKDGDKSYFTTDFLLNPKGDNSSKYYDLFKSSIVPLEGRPVFEVDTCRLTNSSMLGKEGSKLNDKGEFNEKDRDPEGRNGKLLYISYYEESRTGPSKVNTSFSEIRNLNGDIDKAKSLISVPIVLATSLAQVFANWLTYIPMKLGEYLLSKQNPFAKAFGYLLFTPAAIVKNLVNIGSTILKAPILLFVANETKYGDQYFTRWKYQLKERWKEAKSDFNVFKDGKREPAQEEKLPNLPPAVGTWSELDARRPGIEEDLKKHKTTNSEPAHDKSLSKESLLSVTPQQAEEKLRALKPVAPTKTAVDSDSHTHVDRLQQRPTPPTSPRI